MKPAYKNSHQDIIDQCKQGRPKAQFQLYRLYYKAMYNTSLRIVGNAGEAEDVMQEAFLSAFRKINDYKGEVSFGSWLKKIVINRSLDFVRGQRFNFQVIDDQIRAIPDESSLTPEQPITIEELKQSIMNLPDKYRIVLSLNMLEGYDHEEIASILHISEATSRSQLYRARQKIKKQLSHSGKSGAIEKKAVRVS